MTTVTPTNGGSAYSVGSNQVNLGTQNSPNVVNSGSTPSTSPAPSNPQPQGNSNVNAQGTYTGYIAPNQVNVGTAQNPDIRTSGGTTGTNTGNQNTNQGTQNSTPQQQVQNFQNGLDTQYQQTSQKISDIQNGVIPLTPGEQAQIQGLQQQFQTLIQNQQLTNTNASGVANIRGYQTGAAEYDPSFQAKTIGSIVSAGQSKIADLNIKMASAVAALTQSFHDNDIKNVKDAWDMYSSYATARSNQIQKTIDDATAAAKDARDYAEKQREFNLDYNLKAQQAAGEAIGGNLSPDALKVLAQGYLTSGVLPSFGLGKQGAAMKAAVVNKAVELAGGADNLNPATNAAVFKANQNALKQQQYSLSTAQTAYNIFDANGKLALSLVQGLNKSNSPIVNQLSNSVINQTTGQGQLDSFKAVVNSLRGEYATLVNIKGGGGGSITDADKSAAASAIPDNVTPARLQSILTNLGTEGQNVLRERQAQVNLLTQNMNKAGSTFQQQTASTPIVGAIAQAQAEGYTPEQIVSQLASNKAYAQNVNAAINAGYSPQDIVNYFNKQK